MLRRWHAGASRAFTSPQLIFFSFREVHHLPREVPCQSSPPKFPEHSVFSYPADTDATASLHRSGLRKREGVHVPSSASDTASTASSSGRAAAPLYEKWASPRERTLRRESKRTAPSPSRSQGFSQKPHTWKRKARWEQDERDSFTRNHRAKGNGGSEGGRWRAASTPPGTPFQPSGDASSSRPPHRLVGTTRRGDNWREVTVEPCNLLESMAGMFPPRQGSDRRPEREEASGDEDEEAEDPHDGVTYFDWHRLFLVRIGEDVTLPSACTHTGAVATTEVQDPSAMYDSAHFSMGAVSGESEHVSSGMATVRTPAGHSSSFAQTAKSHDGDIFNTPLCFHASHLRPPVTSVESHEKGMAYAETIEFLTCGVGGGRQDGQSEEDATTVGAAATPPGDLLSLCYDPKNGFFTSAFDSANRRLIEKAVPQDLSNAASSAPLNAFMWEQPAVFELYYYRHHKPLAGTSPFPSSRGQTIPGASPLLSRARRVYQREMAAHGIMDSSVNERKSTRDDTERRCPVRKRDDYVFEWIGRYCAIPGVPQPPVNTSTVVRESAAKRAPRHGTGAGDVEAGAAAAVLVETRSGYGRRHAVSGVVMSLHKYFSFLNPRYEVGGVEATVAAAAAAPSGLKREEQDGRVPPRGTSSNIEARSFQRSSASQAVAPATVASPLSSLFANPDDFQGGSSLSSSSPPHGVRRNKTGAAEARDGDQHEELDGKDEDEDLLESLLPSSSTPFSSSSSSSPLLSANVSKLAATSREVRNGQLREHWRCRSLPSHLQLLTDMGERSSMRGSTEDAPSSESKKHKKPTREKQIQRDKKQKKQKSLLKRKEDHAILKIPAATPTAPWMDEAAVRHRFVRERSVGVLLLLKEEWVYFSILMHTHVLPTTTPPPHAEAPREVPMSSSHCHHNEELHVIAQKEYVASCSLSFVTEPVRWLVTDPIPSMRLWQRAAASSTGPDNAEVKENTRRSTTKVPTRKQPIASAAERAPHAPCTSPCAPPSFLSLLPHTILVLEEDDFALVKDEVLLTYLGGARANMDAAAGHMSSASQTQTPCSQGVRAQGARITDHARGDDHDTRTEAADFDMERALAERAELDYIERAQDASSLRESFQASEDTAAVATAAATEQRWRVTAAALRREWERTLRKALLNARLKSVMTAAASTVNDSNRCDDELVPGNAPLLSQQGTPGRNRAHRSTSGSIEERGSPRGSSDTESLMKRSRRGKTTASGTSAAPLSPGMKKPKSDGENLQANSTSNGSSMDSMGLAISHDTDHRYPSPSSSAARDPARMISFSTFPPAKYLLSNPNWRKKPTVLAMEMRYGKIFRFNH